MIAWDCNTEYNEESYYFIGVSMMKKLKTFELVFTAILLAIIILQSFIPFLGNLPLLVLDITIIHITVIVGGIVLGPKVGFFLGTAWGICSFIRAFTSGSAISLLVFTNPFIAIVPRALVGGLSALLFVALERVIRSDKIRMSIAGAFGSLLNTILVLGLIYLLLGSQYAETLQTSVAALPALLMTIVATNGVPEAIASAVLTPVIATVLVKLIHRRRG